MFHPETGDYEFSEAENGRLRTLATTMMVFGVASLGLAGLLLRRAYGLWQTLQSMTVNPLYANSQNLEDMTVAVWEAFLGAGIPLLFGLLTFSAASSFRKITSTEGSDIPNLIDALTTLKRIYTIALAFAAALFGLILFNIIGTRYLI